MVQTVLEIILEELGHTSLIAINSLRPNDRNTCLIPLPDGIKIQIELDKYEKNLIVGIALGNLSQTSLYRKNVFQMALIANGLPPPQYGIFAFSKKTGDLLLYDALDMKDLSGQKVADYLGFFLEKARNWRQALESGNIPHVSATQTSKGPIGVFGLKL